jgi:membrane protein implicated in regulation of membrane protease activity
MIFLVIGGFGAAVLVLGLIGAGVLDFAHVDLGGTARVQSIAGFLGAFGFGAAAASQLLGARTPGGIALASMVGLAAAVPTAWLAVRLGRWARNLPTDATPTRAHLVGSIGVVVTPITGPGYGEVSVRVAGQPVKLNARADRPLALGTEIFVVEATSDTSVVVEPVNSF